jgi:hypothetical protein
MSGLSRTTHCSGAQDSVALINLCPGWLVRNRPRPLNSGVRHFARPMNSPDYNSYCQPLVGQTLRSVEKKDYSWFFVFADDISIVTESPWRFLSEDRIIVTSEDHGNQFGLPAPVDAAERVLAGVSRKAVVTASITRPTADLIIYFDGHWHLQFLQMSCGYESWRLYIRGNETICTGGGDIAYSPTPVA